MLRKVGDDKTRGILPAVLYMKRFSVITSKLIRYGVALVLSVSLSGCASLSSDNAGLYASIPSGKMDTEPRQLTAEGIKALDEGNLEDAKKAFNMALKMDMTNSHIHFLNGYTYHLLAKNGEIKNYVLALEGYKQALVFNQSNWLADYYLGLAYFDQHKYKQAQAQFAKVAVIRDDDPDVLFDLVTASYQARDPRTANAALGRLREIVPDEWNNGRALSAAVVVKASLNDRDQAQEFLESYRQINKNPHQVEHLERRLRNWENAYDASYKTGNRVNPLAGDKLAQAPVFPWEQQEEDEGEESEQEEDEGEELEQDSNDQEANVEKGDNDKKEATKEAFVEDQMAVVDVVIIRTEEDFSTSKGVNLLSGLQLQFGNTDLGLPAFGFSTSDFDSFSDPTDDEKTTTKTRAISIPAVTYSLNIANSLTARNEILARPTIVALSGQTSEFFSGVEVAAAAVSGGDGDSVSIEKEIGVRLAITPEFLPGDRVKLQVIAERTFLTTPSSSVVFEFRLDTSKTTVNANVAMKFGETLILSGLSEKELERNRDGVPFLQDVPLLQYFFSKATTRDFRKSVMILLTPRRAQFLNRDTKDRDKALEDLNGFERSIKELERLHGAWFTPDSNIIPIVKHMRENSLYKEFRTGDIAPERWNNRKTHKDRMKSALDFLYY